MSVNKPLKKIIVYPLASNPYQRLLYSAFDNKRFTFGYIHSATNVLNSIFHVYRLLTQLIVYRIKGYSILHLHWLYALEFPGRKYSSRTTQILSSGNILLFLFTVRILRIKLVWTIHNILPHEKMTLSDLWFARLITNQCSAKIIHSANIMTELDQRHIDTHNTYIIPHGNYIDVYPNTVDRIEARKRLLIKDDEFVVLFFGLVREYKGVDDLLLAFRTVVNDAPNTRLIIAGQCSDGILRDKIIHLADKYNVNFYNEHVADEDVQLYFHACDVVCLPFKTITTSGSALLALSFGKPIIAPHQGSLLDIPKSVGYLYNHEHSNHAAVIAESILAAVNNPKDLKDKGDEAYSYAQGLSWNEIARQTKEVYLKVIK